VVIIRKPKYGVTKSSRGSKFRGISRNGRKWQVQSLGHYSKRYIGSIGSELQAAKIYDVNSIISGGLSAKTNFTYTCQWRGGEESRVR